MIESNQTTHLTRNSETTKLNHISPLQILIDEDKHYIESELQSAPIRMQSSNRSSFISPETSLWLAVLKEAIKDAQLLVNAARCHPELKANDTFRSEVKELESYFTNPSSSVGGFEFICSIIDADSKNLGKAIVKKYFRGLNFEQCPA